jgi:hypothetical protein
VKLDDAAILESLKAERSCGWFVLGMECWRELGDGKKVRVLVTAAEGEGGSKSDIPSRCSELRDGI